MNGLISAKAQRTSDPPISYLLQVALEVPGMISLAAGLVDQETLPAEEVAKLLQFLQRDERCRLPSLQYGTTGGLQCLRQSILEYLREADEVAYPDDTFGWQNVVVTNGSQQFLHLVGESLIDPGDIVLVSDPTYFVFMGVLESVGARTIGVRFDEDGMVPEALDEILNRLTATGEIRRLKLIYVQSYYQNPTGVSLSADRRKRIFERIERLDREGNFVCLLEDSAYRELYFDDVAVPSMKSLDVNNRYIAMTGSFSKAFAPGLRLGYGLMPPWLVPHVLRQKGNEDFGSTNLCQHLAWASMETGEFLRHADDLRGRYRRKCERMLSAIEEFFPEGVRWIEPRGGLYVWVSLPKGIETGGDSELFRAALEHKTVYVPGEYCYAARPEGPPDRSSMRLTYAYISEEEITEGIRRLGAALRQVMKTVQV